jgi:DNA-binding NarL/FixJ family response regulator
MDKVGVLLADDHAVVRAGIRNALQGLPNLEIVGEAGSGPELLAILEETRPDCLLIDVSMPDFEPIAAIRRIRSRYPMMKILVISAHDDDIYVQGLLAAGVDGYHLKDQPLSDLQLAVQRVLSGEKWVSSRLLDKLVGYTELRFSGPGLTSRQQEILELLQQGLDNQTIARRLGLSVKTIEKHLTALYRQLDVQSRLEAVQYAAQHPEILAISGRTAAQTSPSMAVATHRQVSVLLVDDSAPYRHRMRRMIGKICPQAMLYEAKDTEEALNLLGRVAPQLAFVDVVLGNQSGIRCTRRMKASLPQIRIVLISAYPDREFHRQGLEAGAVAFLDKKDLDAATLRQVIEDVAEND